MNTSKTKFKTVDEYIDSFPPEIVEKLEILRKTIRKAAPKAEEMIAYDMAGYKLNGPLIYFGVFKKHIGIYPGSTKIKLDEEVPVKTITELVKQQLERNNKKSTKK